jgi:ribose 5-phosphate isomerase B
VHAKRLVIEALERLGIVVEDMGAYDEQSVDYPDYARRVASAVAASAACRGVLLCGTGIGMSIAANKIPGIRAALVHDAHSAKMSRLHNDANVLVLGADSIAPAAIDDILAVWLSTAFEGGRHGRRVEKINGLDGGRRSDVEARTASDSPGTSGAARSRSAKSPQE